MKPHWNLKEKISAEFINKFPEINPMILQLLFNRKLFAQKNIDQFLTLDYSAGYDPYAFREMEKAVARIQRAIQHQERIVVHGDYDADGVCASALLMRTLKKLGAKNLDIYIPHRESEGYGLNKQTINFFVEEKIDLIITVDCGVANAEEVRLAKAAGMDVIITDHHAQPLINPDSAFAIINPSMDQEAYPEKIISGTAVAFKLAQALIKKNNLGEAFEKWLLDLVAISTVTDCIPLIGENRLLTYFGLRVLRKTQKLGLQELIKISGKAPEAIDVSTIAFQLGPRLNAAGRMDHANTAYELLMAEERQEAQVLAERLNKANNQRQTLTERITREALAQIQAQQNEKIFLITGKDWPLGVVGLVAGKIAAQYYKPTLLFTNNKGEISGSGRSVEEFNMIEALKEKAEFFSRYGGHSQACGFTLKSPADLENFKNEFRAFVTEKLQSVVLQKKLNIDAELNFPDINWELMQGLEQFAPFGEGNPKPLFLTKNLTITDIQPVGAEGKHLRLNVQSPEGSVKKMIGFSFGKIISEYQIGEKIEVVYELGVNQWNGTQELQLKIVELCKS